MVGAVNVPIINRSVVWWNSLHQPPSITAGKSAIEATFLVPLLIAVIGFSLLFGAIVLMRMRTLIAQEQVEARLRRRALDDDATVAVAPAMEQA
jgi:heme exporter protein C